MSAKRVFVGGDLHCGHRSGLTPPRWQVSARRERFGKFRHIQEEAWNWFAQEVKSLGRIDAAFWLGDMIDGRGERSGGTELIVTDRDEQCEMAEEIVAFVNAKANVFIRGTVYHVGEEEDWENIIARAFNELAKDHEWPSINGVVFDLKHHVAGSQVPYGRATPLKRDAVWNVIWNEADYQPRAQIYIRAHTHAHEGSMWMAGARQKWAFIIPALQGMGSKWGARRMSGTVDFGFMHFDIGAKGEIEWQSHIAFVRAQKARVRLL